MSAETPFEPGMFGRFQLVERLAIGGMAEIFKAKTHGAHGFEKTLVVKRILPDFAADEEFVELFISEAKAMMRLDHPKIVQVLDFGEVGGQYFMAMEYVDGLDGLRLLRRCAKQRVRPTTGISVHVVAEVLDALDHAHDLCDENGANLGIVHRDVSPSNIFISRHGDVKLGDFGIASGGHDGGGPRALRGKYGYMSPEQVSGRGVDPRTDVFAAGIVLAELLMVRRLFMADNDVELLLQVRDARLDRLYKYGRQIPPDLREILEAALSRDPALRYQNAAAFRDALHRYLFDNRRMVRTSDVRNFLERLETLTGSLERRSTRTGPSQPAVTEKAPRRPETERPAPPPSGYEAYAKPTGPPLPVAVTERKAVKTGPPHPAVAAAWRAAWEATPLPRGGVPPAQQAQRSVGRKRKIQLTPPPLPEPVPQECLTDRREMTTDEALAALPEIGAGAATGSSEFRTAQGGAARPAVPPVPLSELDTPVEPASVAALRTTTPIAGVPRTEPHLRGDLALRTTISIVFELAVDEETGLLVLKNNEAVKEIYLVDGDPQYVNSNREEELFGQYLVKKGVISKGELSMALAMLSHFDGKLGDTLVALNLLKPVQVLRHLTHSVRQKLLDAFTWTSGGYVFFRGEKTERRSAPLGLNAFELIGSAIEQLEAAEVSALLQPHRAKHLRAVVPPPMPPEVFRLGAAPRRAYDKLTGQHPLQRLLGRFDDEEQLAAFARMVYLLLETGLAVAE